MMHMWQWLVQTLQAHPELAIFLTLAMGYWVGALKLGSFSLGAVTGTAYRHSSGKYAGGWS